MKDALWAVTCSFNPQGYKRRRLNYLRFREALSIPLVAVELAYDEGSFDLQPGDADILIQLRGGDVMWQKERLLNLAVQRLAPECTAVATLDSDIIFSNPSWPEMAMTALETHAVVQPFDSVVHLDRSASNVRTSGNGVRTQPGLAHRARETDPTALVFGSASTNAAPGFAWVYRRSLLDRHGLFEGCVLGGGDVAIVGANWGLFDWAISSLRMNPAHRRYYLEWAESWHRDVAGQVGSIPGEVSHLWHGHFADRRYVARYQGLMDFDPGADIRAEPGAPLRWNSDKPRLHKYVANYFAARLEDGWNEDRPIVIARHPRYQANFYDCVIDWAREQVPEVLDLLDVRNLPFDIKSESATRAVVMWLQDPVEAWSPETFILAEGIARYCDSQGIPVLNRPSYTSVSRKATAAPIIASAGFRVPRMKLIHDAESFKKDAGGLPFPLFVREDGKHQSRMLPARSLEELQSLPIDSFRHPVAVELIDVADPRDGLFRRFRYLVCGEVGVTLSLRIEDQWIVRGGNPLPGGPTEEEVRYCSNPDPHHDRFQAAMRALKLDFGAFDYSYDHEGQVVVWEVNPFPELASSVGRPHDERAEHRGMAAMLALYLTKANLPIPDTLAKWVRY